MNKWNPDESMEWIKINMPQMMSEDLLPLLVTFLALNKHWVEDLVLNHYERALDENKICEKTESIKRLIVVGKRLEEYLAAIERSKEN